MELESWEDSVVKRRMLGSLVERESVVEREGSEEEMRSRECAIKLRGECVMRMEINWRVRLKEIMRGE